ncbi:hypothetical protein B9Z55_015573 [Caenorhabditis nigoni]|nr:hypothetical protein B9Z55_015573 [Caenorhabditis nigoni]
MEEPPRNPKFGLLKCPFALREEVIGNMDFMDAFHFSTLSKRSKQMVRKARYQIDFIKFRFEENIKNDRIEVKIKNNDWLKISMSDSNDPPVRDPTMIDGLKLANLIDEPSDDYRKKLSAHILSIFHFKSTHVHLERNIEHLDDLFLWDIRKQFDCVEVCLSRCDDISPEDLQLVLNNLVSKSYLLEFELNDSSYKYQKPLKYCESLDVRGSCQWLDPENILQRNPQMKDLNLEDLPGEQVNNLLKQWINGEGIGLESMGFEISWYNGIDYPDNVIFDGIDTMETKLT